MKRQTIQVQINSITGGVQKGWCLTDLNERIPVIHLEQKQILNVLGKQDLIQDNKYKPKGEGR